MALAVIWMSVAVGIALGLWQRVAGRATGPIRTFAVVAAGLVVAVSLLPHAIESKGLAGLGASLASIALVPALERLFRVAFRRVTAEGLRLELGYAGLLLHRVGDGAVMGVGGHGSELTWAVGAHEIPIVALVTLAYARRGLQAALLRVALLGLASTCGYWLIHSAPAGLHELHGWVDAIAAGILVHILVYEALPDTLHTARERASDVLGAALGLFVIALPGADEHADAPNVAHSLLHTTLAAAPALLLGLLGSAAVLWQARRRGRADASAPLQRVAIARPYPALEAFSLLVRGIGWLGSLGYVIGASALALAATPIVRKLSQRPTTPASDAAVTSVLPSNFWSALEALVLRVGGWIGVGLLGATYIESFVPSSELLAAPDALLGAAFIAAVAAPASICSGFAVPIASALMAKGLAPGLAVSGLALGAVLANAASALARADVGPLASFLGLAPLALAWLTLGVWLAPASRPLFAGPPSATQPSLVEWTALALLAVLVSKSIWRVGIRGWLGASLQALAPAARRPHAHAH
jgi:uncharacterized membrane protein YraQ (UPF0718 family)